MPSAFSAKDNKALVATCVACQKSCSVEKMVSLPGSEAGKQKYYSVCLECADRGWRPPGFRGVYHSRPE